MSLSWASKGLETELDTQVDDGAWHATPVALHARCRGASEQLCCRDTDSILHVALSVASAGLWEL